MNKKLYVGGLSYSVTDEQLQEIFSAHGAVESAKVITDRFTGSSRGFGFVTFTSNDPYNPTLIVPVDFFKYRVQSAGTGPPKTIPVLSTKEFQHA